MPGRDALLAPDATLERSRSNLRWQVFALTWLSYAAYYQTRKPVSVVKNDLIQDFGFSKIDLANIDTAYLAAYAVGQFAWGWLGDKVGARRMLTFGMLATASVTILFGLSTHILMFTALWCLNGLFQATGWPGNMKGITPWINPGRRGAIMGLWSTCYQGGGLVAPRLAAAFIPLLAWPGAFFGPAGIVIVVALLVFFFLPDVRGGATETERADLSTARREARAEVIRNPLLWALGGSYFFMKLIRYALLFWAMLFMQESLGYSTLKAATVVMSFEAGGLLGSVTIGWMSERFFEGRRLSVGITSLVLLAVALPIYGAVAGLSTAANVAALATVGFFLFGPDTLLSATAAQDIGGVRAASTAAGFINGVGSIGPIAGGYITAAVSTAYGWGTVFTLLGVGAAMSALVLVPFWWRSRRAGPA